MSHCHYISHDLTSNQEEADTKVILHTIHALSETPSLKVVIRSPSADTDIFVIALGVINERNRVYLDYSVGKNRKGSWLSDIDIPEEKRNALIGFHAFTANDYI